MANPGDSQIVEVNLSESLANKIRKQEKKMVNGQASCLCSTNGKEKKISYIIRT